MVFFQFAQPGCTGNIIYKIYQPFWGYDPDVIERSWHCYTKLNL